MKKAHLFAALAAAAVLVSSAFCCLPVRAAELELSLHDPLAPPATGGVELVDRALAKLATHRRLLVLGAHPDDEDTGLLTWVARGQGGEAAYLALNRGEGGQNLIGPELGVGLGLVRSQELLAARRLDGARQYFTRAYDFGYTRSLDETFERWPQAMLEEDVLRIVRRFRPQVLVSVFPPTAAAGHGQHQAAGVLAPLAFERAGELGAAPELLDEGLAPWSPLAFYRLGWFDREAEANRFPLGDIDPLSGLSTQQIARASRGLHRSQDMGTLLRLGAGEGRLLPVAGAATLGADDAETGPFAAIDTRLAALLSPLEDDDLRRRLEPALERTEALARETRRRLSPSTLGTAGAPLARILGALREVRGELEPAIAAATPGRPGAIHAAALLDEKIEIAEQALAAAAGIAFDAYTDRETLVPGEGAELVVEVWNSSLQSLEVEGLELALRTGMIAEPLAAERDGEEESSPSWPTTLAPGELGSWRFALEVAEDAAPDRPYFLDVPLAGDVYDWSEVPAELRGRPFGEPPVSVRARLAVGGTPLALAREAVHRFADQARGEMRRPLRVAPALELSVTPETIVWPLADREPRELEVLLVNRRAHPVRGKVVLEAPGGWPAPEPRAFALDAGAQRRLQLALEPPPELEAGTHTLRLFAEAEGGRYAGALPLVEYEHLRPLPLPVDAEVVVHAGRLELPAVERVGYVRGASDRVPEALERLGVPVEILDATELAVGDLSVYDAIVVGSRAYESDPALARANPRLLDYARAGGRLVVQYQQYQFVRGGFAPFPLDIARPHDRITDEGAVVTTLDPEHPLLAAPNAIGPDDWRGWVQERGLYFAHEWDEVYEPLLEMADPGGTPQRGGLLVTELGDGLYVYTGLAFFRQLPAGVIGAYRLFLNLLGDRPAEPSTGASR